MAVFSIPCCCPLCLSARQEKKDDASYQDAFQLGSSGQFSPHSAKFGFLVRVSTKKVCAPKIPSSKRGGDIFVCCCCCSNKQTNEQAKSELPLCAALFS